MGFIVRRIGCYTIFAPFSRLALLDYPQALFVPRSDNGHPVEKTVFHAQFPEACFAMGFPCGDLVPAAVRIKEAL